MKRLTRTEYDYVVVGSGAGGGTVASRLAERGASVVVLEAGGDPRELSGSDPAHLDTNALPVDYDVPAFHVLACENDALKWDFFVKHYAHEANGESRTILYPRAGTLGGCTAHNAMIFIAPHNEDWRTIAEITSDESWQPEQMRQYFERVERCGYRPDQRLLHFLGLNPSRHGFGGWLNVELPCLPFKDILEVIEPILPEIEREFAMDGRKLRELKWLAEAGLDANDWRLVCEDSVGLRKMPLATSGQRRCGTRERLLDVKRRHPQNLDIVLDALATNVIFDETNRASGVRFLQGKGLYRAGRHGSDAGIEQKVFARHDVILAGGVFNTPQLLMLSGIGPGEHLRERGIDVRVDLRGVGANLQDRYEIGVVNRMEREWPFFAGATFSRGDPQFELWDTSSPTGVYTTNGGALALAMKSSVAEGPPDLFCMLLLASFKGYYPDFSRELTQRLNYMTWVVLKAHTENRAGTVRLRSSDPRDPPEIEFNYFKEGGGNDLQAMIEGVKYVRKLGEPLRRSGVMNEELPGDPVSTDEQIGDFIRKHAWGHHASCTCPIGAAGNGGVLSSDFRVHGVSGLRVVDASAFPRIPGFFITSAIYMIAEKAADAILESRKSAGGV